MWILQDLSKWAPYITTYRNLKCSSGGNSHRNCQGKSIAITADLGTFVHCHRARLQFLGINSFSTFYTQFRITMPLHNYTFGKTLMFEIEKFSNVDYRNNAVKWSVKLQCSMPDKIESQWILYNSRVYRYSKNHRAITNSVFHNAIKNTERHTTSSILDSCRVEMLIGAEIFSKLICPGQLQQDSIPPLLPQETVLDWVASGKINHFNADGSTVASSAVHTVSAWNRLSRVFGNWKK